MLALVNELTGAALDVLVMVDELTGFHKSGPMSSMRPTSWGSARNRRARTGREAVEMAGVVLGYRAIWHDRGPPAPPNRPRPVWGVISIPLI